VEVSQTSKQRVPGVYPEGRLVTRDLKQRLAQLHHGDHVCSFYKSPDEELALAVSWISEGLSRGEGGICVTGGRSAEEFSRALAAAGVDVEKERRYGSLLFVSKWNWRIEGGFNARLMG